MDRIGSSQPSLANARVSSANNGRDHSTSATETGPVDSFQSGTPDPGLMPRPTGFWGKVVNGLVSVGQALPQLHFDSSGNASVDGPGGMRYGFDGSVGVRGGANTYYNTDGSTTYKGYRF